MLYGYDGNEDIGSNQGLLVPGFITGTESTCQCGSRVPYASAVKEVVVPVERSIPWEHGNWPGEGGVGGDAVANEPVSKATNVELAAMMTRTAIPKIPLAFTLCSH